MSYNIRIETMAFLSLDAKEEIIALLPDEEILERSVREPALFGELVRRYEEPFRDRARHLLGYRDEVEDVIQDTFVKIYKAAPRFREVEGASFRSWAYAILKNTAFSKYGKEKREWQSALRVDAEVLANVADEKSFKMEDRDLKESVFRILARMPAQWGRVLRLYFLEGRSQKEIAVLESISVGAVKTRMHRAKKCFKEMAAGQISI